MFNQYKIIVYVTGGIAAYKAANFVRLLIKNGAEVRVAMTRAAESFVTPLTFATLTQHPVLRDETLLDGSVPHVEWAQWADVHFVVPATANVIAKMANGIADDVVTTTLLAAQGPKVIAPAMNDQMWDNPATQRNLKTLEADGLVIVEPAVGFLAEGYEAKGRLADEALIITQAWTRLQAQSGRMQGKKVLITAGGTREALDPVRYLTNRSSGKMGYSLAQAAAEAGATVTLVTAAQLPAPYGVEVIAVDSTQKMYDVVIQKWPDHDIFIGSAAVSDFRPTTLATHKIKKQGEADMTVSLTQNPDILATVGQQKRSDQLVIGFAAETQNVVGYAQDKLVRKHADMIVANDVSRLDAGFEVETNEVTLVTQTEVQALPLQDKLATARAIIDYIATKKAHD